MWALIALALAGGVSAQERTGPLRIEITEGVIEPLPTAIPAFVPENPGAQQLAQDITRVVVADLVGSGLFREIPRSAHISRVTDFAAPVKYSDWSAINAQALITGAASSTSDGKIIVKFRLHDVFAQGELGQGQQLVGTPNDWRRMAHKIADQVYSRLTGEAGYFDSKIAFVAEDGPKNARNRRLAVMDQDGADVRFLTEPADIVLAPRWSPDNSSILFTSYASGSPQVLLLNTQNLQTTPLGVANGATFAPRFSPDGGRVVLSQTEGSNTDIYSINLANGRRARLTNSPAIDTAPSYSPDGSQIVFESDRGGTQQLYVMSARGGNAQRISFGDGRYATPVWSPRGDLIAFTKILNGRFHIGVMRTDGSGERLLTSSFLEEGPTWSPNGRVISFFRESRGETGGPSLYSVDVTGRNERRIATPGFASAPDWSALLP